MLEETYAPKWSLVKDKEMIEALDFCVDDFEVEEEVLPEENADKALTAPSVRKNISSSSMTGL